jgi:regulator of RNase E activity RraA
LVVRGNVSPPGSRDSTARCVSRAPADRGLRQNSAPALLRPVDGATRKRNLLGYYEYLAQSPHPAIAVVEDIDSLPGLGAFWGEVNTTVHWGLGCHGAITNGSMRDLDAMCPQFQCPRRP